MAQASTYNIGTKSDLLTCFDEFSEEVPTISHLVLDGAAIVQMLKPAATNNLTLSHTFPHNFTLHHACGSIVWDIASYTFKILSKAQQELRSAQTFSSWCNYIYLETGRTSSRGQ